MLVLLVDDSAPVRMTLGALLEEAGHEVIEADSVAAARARLPERSYDAVLLDVHLGDGLGPDLIPEVRRLSPAPVVVLLSGTSAAEDLVGADLVFVKADDPEELVRRVGEAASRRP